MFQKKKRKKKKKKKKRDTGLTINNAFRVSGKLYRVSSL